MWIIHIREGKRGTNVSLRKVRTVVWEYEEGRRRSRGEGLAYLSEERKRTSSSRYPFNNMLMYSTQYHIMQQSRGTCACVTQGCERMRDAGLRRHHHTAAHPMYASLFSFYPLSCASAGLPFYIHPPLRRDERSTSGSSLFLFLFYFNFFSFSFLLSCCYSP